MTTLLAAQLYERRRSPLSWGLPLGLWSAFIVSIFPSIETELAKVVRGYPQALKEAFGVGELTSAEQYLHAEMLSLIVPLAVGYLAVRSVSSGLSGAAESGGSRCFSQPRCPASASWRPDSWRPRSSSPRSSR